jgi:DeoR/GlpR family transcriptional regulator of sugar metabolism
VQKQARLLKIWKLCRERRRSVGDLAEMCAVKERTIYRDIRALEDIGVSLAYDRGYYIAHEAPLPQLALTPTESRPSRARGLKHFNRFHCVFSFCVAPPAGAWIETRLTAI